LQKLQDKTEELHHLINFAASHEKNFESLQDTLTSKIVFFSVIIIGAMVLIGLLETFVLRQSIINRKNM
jgi:hypothetical protein